MNGCIVCRFDNEEGACEFCLSTRPAPELRLVDPIIDRDPGDEDTFVSITFRVENAAHAHTVYDLCRRDISAPVVSYEIHQPPLKHFGRIRSPLDNLG